MVSDFKAQIAADTATFLNLDEFADSHEIDGRQIPAVVDESAHSKHPLSYAEGVFSVQKTLYVSLSELGYKPEEGQWVTLDGVRMRVVQAADDAGVLTIKLEANAT